MPKSKIVYTCCGKKIVSKKLLKAHMELFHGIDVLTQNFEQKMLSHIDAAEWFSSSYEMTGGGVTFTIDTWHERDDASKLFWVVTDEEK